MAINVRNWKADTGHHQYATGQTQAGDIGGAWPGNRLEPPGDRPTITLYAVDDADGMTITTVKDKNHAENIRRAYPGSRIRKVIWDHDTQERELAERRDNFRLGTWSKGRW